MKERLLQNCREEWQANKKQLDSSEEAFTEAVEANLPNNSVFEAFAQCYALELMEGEHYLSDLGLRDKDTISLDEVVYAVLRRFYYDSGMLEEAQKEDDGREVICVGVE